MNKDDVLRVLELLPAWKLRAPSFIQDVAPIAAEKVLLEKVLEENVLEEKLPAEKAAEPAPTLTQKIDADVEIYQSEDSTWVFVCSASRIDTSSQSMLLNNIFAALQIKPKKYDGDLAAIQSKVIVAMGESVAQILLNTQDSLENLRGKLHMLGNSKLIASNDLAHLLANPQDKAKLWQDLCLARDHIKSLD
jgi:DNA polymerase III psi subunit